LNQEFSADAAMLSLRHENIDFSPTSVQLRSEINDALPCKRHQKRCLSPKLRRNLKSTLCEQACNIGTEVKLNTPRVLARDKDTLFC